MPTASVTVQQAMDRSTRLIERPSIIIMAAGPVLCVLLLIFYFSWWDLVLLPLAFLCSFLYTQLLTPGWRAWAYENVNDIHQFQRSAEIAGLLAPQSWQDADVQVQQRLAADAQFFDDPSIPGETIIYCKQMFMSSRKPGMTISDKGIDIQSDRFFPWSEIENERVASVGYHHTDRLTGMDRPSGSEQFFRFEYPDGRIEVPMSSISISAWKLDLLLYTYRGRYMLKQHSANSVYA